MDINLIVQVGTDGFLTGESEKKLKGLLLNLSGPKVTAGKSEADEQKGNKKSRETTAAAPSDDDDDDAPSNVEALNAEAVKLASKVVDADGPTAVKAVLKGLGFERVSQVSPKKLPEFIKQLKAILAGTN